jgi:glycogen debranching enzyme
VWTRTVRPLAIIFSLPCRTDGSFTYLNDLSSRTDESYHVCHAGYISLFPFLLQLLPPSSPHLSSVLELLRDPNQLWSDYGLRSLSKKHALFGKGENYWRGPIWVQMNYLALAALKNVRSSYLSLAVLRR